MKKNKASFLDRWSEKKSQNQLDKDEHFSQKNKKIKTNKLLESTDEVNDKYENLSEKEALQKLKLPDPNKLKNEKDLDIFFKNNIPEKLKRIAMRRLWRLNPVIRFADAEINDYADDFTDAATVIDDLKTSYIAGKGYLFKKSSKEKKHKNIKSIKKTKSKINKKPKNKQKVADVKSNNKILDEKKNNAKNQKESEEIYKKKHVTTETIDDLKEKQILKPKHMSFKKI